MVRSLTGTQPGGPRRGSSCAEAKWGIPDTMSTENAAPAKCLGRMRIAISSPAMWARVYDGDFSCAERLRRHPLDLANDTEAMFGPKAKRGLAQWPSHYKGR